MHYYTYAYLREDRTPYYIGKGKGDRIYSKQKYIKPPKDKSRIIYLKQNLTEEEAFKHEIYMIDVFGRIDLDTGILHNRTDGGEGSSGCIPSEEHKRKISEARKGKSYPKREGKLYSKGKGKNHYNYDKTLSEETKKKINKATKGKKLTIDHKKKISESNKGKSKTITKKSKNSVIIRAKARTGIPGHKHSEETKRKISKATQGKVPWNKGIKNPNITGGKSPAAKKIYYDGTIYDCILNAIKITNKSYYHIKKYGTIVS